jgi:hypothetical protein
MKSINLMYMLIAVIGMIGCEKKNSCEDYITDVEDNNDVENTLSLGERVYSANLPALPVRYPCFIEIS